MKKLIVFLIVIVFVFATSAAAADDYTINEHVDQYSPEYKVACFIAVCSVLMFIYAVVIGHANKTSLAETIQD